MDEAELCLWLRRSLRYVRSKLKITLNKDLSQHLMVWCDLGLMFKKLLKSIKAKYAFELGTGTGFLTKFIATTVEHVVSIEIDPRLLYVAYKILDGEYNVSLVLGDGIRHIESECVRADVIVSNTPFHITSQLIISFIKSRYPYAIITLQQEVAERLIASAGSANYSRLSVLAKLFLEVKDIKTYPPQAFYPRPEVSATLVLLKKKQHWSSNYENLEGFLACLFSQRRRKLRKALIHCFGKESLNVVKGLINDELRVFKLNPEDFLNLYLRFKDLMST